MPLLVSFAQRADLPPDGKRCRYELCRVVRVVVGKPGRSARTSQLGIAGERPEIGIHRIGLPEYAAVALESVP